MDIFLNCYSYYLNFLRVVVGLVRGFLRGLRQHHHPQGPQRAPIAQDVGHRTAGIKLDRLSE